MTPEYLNHTNSIFWVFPEWTFWINFFQVQASAAWALSPCIKNAANSGDMVRCVNFAIILLVAFLLPKCFKQLFSTFILCLYFFDARRCVNFSPNSFSANDRKSQKKLMKNYFFSHLLNMEGRKLWIAN